MVMNVELQATCSALGYLDPDDNRYVKEPDCIETVKDLIRFLKHEEDCDVRRQLGNAQIVRNDFIPLLKEYHSETALFDIILRLLVNLTQPAILCFHNQIPDEKSMRNFYLEVQEHLCSYKEAFADENLFAILSTKLGDLLKLDWENRQEEDRLIIERTLIIIRNILHVPPHPRDEKRTDDDASVHDQVLWALHMSGMEDLLLYIASSPDEKQFSMHALEIISLMFREQTANQLAHAGATRSLTEKEKDEQELIRIREHEKIQKKQNIMKYSTRHSRFGGTYVVSNMKSITNNNLIYHRSLGDANKISFDQGKRAKKKASNRKPIMDTENSRRSTLSIRLFLKEFCIQFLENCYNPLMASVKDTLRHNNQQENDETYYLWSLRFFMEFSRLYDFKVDVISETISVSTFHYIHMQMTRYHDMITTEKKDAITWSKRLHLGLRAYKELFLTLQAMDCSNDENLIESAKVIKSNVFYMIEYREIFPMLLKSFNQSRQSRGFLKDLIETTHVFLRMLEKYIGINKHVMVQKKQRNVRKKKQKQNNQASGAVVRPPQYSEEELEEMWDNVSDELSAILQGRGDVPADVTPFDAASEQDMEQQKMQAIIRIQDCLRNQEAGMAIALLRAAREVWPENDVFGAAEVSPENEFMCLREFFMQELQRPEQEPEVTMEIIPPELEDDDEEDEQARNAATGNAEQEFDFKEFVTKFSNPNILKPYVLLLSEYKKNSLQTNHQIVRMLHRIAVDCKMVALLFQLSLFRVFHSVLNGATKSYKELVTFAQYVLRKFFEIAEKNKKVFMELLFWKNVRDAVELTEGYGSYQSEATRVKQLWTEEQDAELLHLYDEFKDREEDDKDVVDIIMDNLIDKRKTRRQVIIALVRLELIGSARELRKKKSRGDGGARNRGWREEQEVELRELFERYRESDDPLGDIVGNLSDKRSKKKVMEKLLEMGIVGDRKELYKKRKRSGGGGSRRANDRNDRSDSEDDENREPLDNMEPNAERATSPDDQLDDANDSLLSTASSSSSESEGEDGAPSNKSPVSSLLKKVIDAGLQAQVTWLKGLLESTAEDRQNGPSEPVPIVPITEEHYDALESKQFQNLMKKLGIRPPANEQESFWRIPANLVPEVLRGHASWLDPNFQGVPKSKVRSTNRFAALKSLAKKKRNEVKEKEESHKKKPQSPSSGKTSPKRQNDPKRQNNKKSAEQVAEDINDSDSNAAVEDLESSLPGPTQQLSSDSDSDDDVPLNSVRRNAKKSRIKKKTFSSDSENSDEDDKLVIDTSQMSTNKRSRVQTADSSLPPSKRSRVLSDDETDATPAAEPPGTLNPDEFTLEVEGAPETQPIASESFPATQMTQDLDSNDSDINDHMPLKRVMRRQQIESDSSDDN
ncbi:protein timeless homolog [Tubulanus polymorphus]|uniref:protein timeless homolog n=1 Tax=Tubulanus polymorphus TaxID=672921 RepID=UPI003DA206B8